MTEEKLAALRKEIHRKMDQLVDDTAQIMERERVARRKADSPVISGGLMQDRIDARLDRIDRHIMHLKLIIAVTVALLIPITVLTLP